MGERDDVRTRLHYANRTLYVITHDRALSRKIKKRKMERKPKRFIHITRTHTTGHTLGLFKRKEQEDRIEQK